MIKIVCPYSFHIFKATTETKWFGKFVKVDRALNQNNELIKWFFPISSIYLKLHLNTKCFGKILKGWFGSGPQWWVNLNRWSLELPHRSHTIQSYKWDKIYFGIMLKGLFGSWPSLHYLKLQMKENILVKFNGLYLFLTVDNESILIADLMSFLIFVAKTAIIFNGKNIFCFRPPSEIGRSPRRSG